MKEFYFPCLLPPEISILSQPNSKPKLIRRLIRHPRKTIASVFNPAAGPDVRRPGNKAELDLDIFSRLPVTFHTTSLGNFYTPAHASDDIVAKAIRAGRIFEPYVIDVATSYAKPGTLILDIGANFGQMSVLFSRMAGSDGMVFSFEAQRYCFAILQQNLAANKCKNARAFYGAVMEKGGQEVSFPEPDLTRFRTYGSYPLSLDAGKDASAKVKTLAIDDLKIDFPISFCKIDTQGSDIFGLRGMRETALKHRMPILFEFEERFQEEFGTTFQDYVDFVQSIDYRFVKTFADINFLILPALPKTISTPAPAAASAIYSPRVKQHDMVAETKLEMGQHLCKFLKTESEIQDCITFLNENGFVSHACTPKNWDIAHLISEIGDGNILDMGSSDSHILKNVCLKKTSGKKYGIDLRAPDNPTGEITYLQGTLLETPLPDQHLNYITCISVIEHQVDPSRFARETSRLLAPGGKLFVSFDYWEPLLKIPIKVYDLDWQPLDRKLTEVLIEECAKNKLRLLQEVDWTTQDQIIRWGYYSPHPDASYTFGLLVFEKSA